MRRLTITEGEADTFDTEMNNISAEEAMFLSCAFTIATAKSLGLNEAQLNEAMNDLWEDDELAHVKR